MSSAAQTAVDMANQAKTKAGTAPYVLVLEGAVPEIFDGRGCIIATNNGQELTYKQAVTNFTPNAAAIVNVGTCSCYGGIPMSGPVEYNPMSNISCTTLVKSIDPNKLIVNLPGCPAHPEWIAWAVVRLILAVSGQGSLPTLDAYNRPTDLYGSSVHENCPRNLANGGIGYATTIGQDGYCLLNLGCRGPSTHSNCPTRKWQAGENGPINWCVEANAPCIGCVEPTFPGDSFYANL
jgi:hydrogenase small subunit